MDADIANRPPDKNGRFEDDLNKKKLPQDPVSLYIVSIMDQTEWFYREYDRNFSQKRNLPTEYFHMDSTKMMSDVHLFVKATAGPV